MSIYGVSSQSQLRIILNGLEDLKKIFVREGDDVRAHIISKQILFLKHLVEELQNKPEAIRIHP